MESMHKIVDSNESIFAAIPTIEVDAKLHSERGAARDHERFLPILEPSV
jgi:hypothetical protein